MTLANFYLVCFLVGFLLSLVAVLSGTFDLHLHDLHHADFGHVDAGHADHPGHAGHQLSIFNFGTIAAFLAWFGGTGFLLERYASIWFLFGIGIAFLVGLAGASVVFLFVAKVLISTEENLNPADYDMIGVLAHVSSPIRAGGTGELIYTQGGTRHTCGARSEDGSAIEKGAEVVVTRFEKGIAYVQRWEDLTASPQ
ncbi:MAG: NfeD family protein [Bryobacterales bacterium]|nr:NfeD family protein [Bryobacterales bacterium]